MRTDDERPGAPLWLRLREIAFVFLKLGCLGFGGPAAHVALLEDEVVSRRAWLRREDFLELLAWTHLIPGPNSTEMAIHVGYRRAGWPGLAVAGVCFIGPAALITGTLAWVYVRYGTRPQAAPFLAGIQAAVLAVILAAVWKLAKAAIRSARGAVLGVVVLGLVLVGLGEVPALFVGAALGLAILRRPPARKDAPPPNRSSGATLGPLAALAQAIIAPTSAAFSAVAAAGPTAGPTLVALGLFFLKVGAVLFGGGYVLVAFIEGELVDRWHWLERTQLLDAVAAGQLTPGPILSTATFIGYVLAGVPGAAVSTLGIFFPSFVFVVLVQLLLPRLRRGPTLDAFLAGVQVSAVALMAAALVRLGGEALGDPRAVLLFLLALFATLRFRASAVVVVLGAAALGWVLYGFGR